LKRPGTHGKKKKKKLKGVPFRATKQGGWGRQRESWKKISREKGTRKEHPIKGGSKNLHAQGKKKQGKN